MSDDTEAVRVFYTSDVDEEFLVADLEVAGTPCCQILKRSESGPVFLAFFKAGSGEQTLIDPDSFIEVIRRAVGEILALKAPR